MKKITRVNLKFTRPLFTKNPPEIKKDVLLHQKHILLFLNESKEN